MAHLSVVPLPRRFRWSVLVAAATLVGSLVLVGPAPASASETEPPPPNCADDPLVGTRYNFSLETTPLYQAVVTREHCEDRPHAWRVDIWTWCPTGTCQWIPIYADLADDGWLWSTHYYAGAGAFTLFKVYWIGDTPALRAYLTIDDYPPDGEMDHGSDGWLFPQPPAPPLPEPSPPYWPKLPQLPRF